MRHDSSVLNSLRAIAVVLVLIDHICETVFPIHPYDWYLGRLGVLLFFVHTSCVLMLSLARTRLDGWPLARHFYVRRLFRIYPLSIVTVVLVLVLEVPRVAWAPDLPDRSLVSVLANLLLVQDLAGVSSVSAPLWSLPLEIQMYAVLPLVFVAIGRGAFLGRALALWVAAVGMALLIPPSLLHLSTFVPCFISGVIAFCLASRVRRTMPFWGWPLALAALIAIYALVAHAGSTVHSAPAAWVTCLLTGTLIPFFKESNGRMAVPPALVAKYSYGVYLSHMIALWIAFDVLAGSPPAVQWFTLFATIGSASVLAFHLLEQPMIAFGTRVANRMTTHPTAVAAAAPLQADGPDGVPADTRAIATPPTAMVS